MGDAVGSRGVTAPARRSPASRDVRTALLDAAEQEIREQGAAGASLRAIARRAEVSHQAPAHFFASRQGLFTALAARTWDRMYAGLVELAAQHAGQPPLDRLVDLGLAYIDFGLANPELFTLVASPDQIDHDDAALIAARSQAWGVLSDCVRDAQEAGWRAGQATESVALGCWALVHGSAALWREGWLRMFVDDAAVRDALRETLRGSL